jgi:integrase
MYRVAIEKYLVDWADKPLRDIQPEAIERKHRAIADEVQRAGRAYRGQVIANFSMATLRILWNFAADRIDDLPRNPVGRLKRAWFPELKRERHVKADQLPAFYRAVMDLPNPIQRDFLLLLLFYGLRFSEAASLTWDDVDFTTGVIRIPAARTKAGRKLDLPLVDPIHSMLVARRNLGRDRYVFPGHSKSGHIADLQGPFRQIEAATGIKVSAHDLRRTFATVCEETEITPFQLKCLLNHSIGRDVTSGYVQLSAPRLREAATKVANRMKELCGISEPPGVRRLRPRR